MPESRLFCRQNFHRLLINTLYSFIIYAIMFSFYCSLCRSEELVGFIRHARLRSAPIY